VRLLLESKDNSSQTKARSAHQPFKAYRKYTTETKEKAIELCKKLGPCKVSNELGIPESSLRRWQKNGVLPTGKGGRKPLFPEVEADLMRWFRDMRNRGFAVTNYSLLTEAQKIAKQKKTLRGFRILLMVAWSKI